MQALSTDNGKAAVGVAQNEHCVRFNCCYQLVGFSDDIAHGLAQIAAYGVHIHFRICQLQIMEEDTVQCIIYN